MSFLAPAALGTLALAIPLVVLYMLRSRRQRLEVPSVRLWEGENEYVSAALPWQRLRITAALILQLLVLAAFALLLARPFFQEETLLGPHTVLVVDTSGSMALAGRLDQAKAQALDLVTEASDQQLISVVDAGPRPRVVAAFSRDPVALRAAIADLRPGGGTEDLAGALRLARGLATPDRPTTTLLFSDGGLEGAVAEPLVDVRHLIFDARSDDVAITAFTTAVPGEGGTRLFIELASFAVRSEDVTVELDIDGLPAGSLTVTLQPGERHQEIVPVDAGPGQTVTATLVGGPDGNPLDDRSAVVLTGAADLSVTVVGEGSVFLDALLGAIPGIRPAAGAPPDLAIVDGVGAAVVDRPSWLIAPETPPPGVTIIGRLDNPVVTYQRPSEPILEGLDLSDLAIAEAQIIEVAGWLPIVRAGDVPLVLLGDVDGHRIVYFAFDLNRSNLPVQVTFPVLGARVLEWLGGGRSVSSITAPAGTAIPIAAPPGAAVRITLPSGEERTLDPGLLQFSDTREPGVYRVDYVDQDGTVLSSLAAARQFVASEAAGGSRQISTTFDGEAAAAESTLLREWAPLILSLLLALVLIEWWVAYGRPIPRRRKVTI